MIKILPLKENNETTTPYFRLVVTLGYGEHCDDTYTHSWVEIDDEKANKYESLTDEELDNMDYFDLCEISGCITQSEAESIVTFINSLWKRTNKNGYSVTHVVLNDDCDEFWWKDEASMTDKEFEWFSNIYEKFSSLLFSPKIEHNWYGITGAKIEYVDNFGKVHMCEVV